MQLQSEEDRINSFLDKKLRYSKSYATRQTYRMAMNKFLEFLRTKYNIDLAQIFERFEEKT